MSDEEILKIMIENDKLKKALAEIANYSVRAEHGYVDEWTEALGFGELQKIAREALGDEYGEW